MIRRTFGKGPGTYSYTDEEGAVLYQVVRRVRSQKGFYQRRPDGKGGWINSLEGVRRVLYRLPEVVAAVRDCKQVLIVEGERDANNLAKLGLVATTNSGGPGRWRKEYAQSLEDAAVVILADNDEAGREHAQKVATALAGVAAILWIVELPDLPPGGDVSDWIERMDRQGADTQAIRAELERLIDEAEIWEPAATGNGGEAAAAAQKRAERVGEALEGLRALGQEPAPAAIERFLSSLAAGLEGCQRLELQSAREAAVRALKRKVSAPAKYVDSALGGVTVARQSLSTPDSDNGLDSPYVATDYGLVYLKTTRDGTVHAQLTNFTAKIVGEVRRDDGVEAQTSFEISARYRGQQQRFEVTSGEFQAMRWVTDKLGATAIVNAGMGTRDHARAAIQHLSDRVAVRTVYTHLGWRQIGREWVYLHAGGAIGTVGTVSGIEVDPPEQLRLYVLPHPPCGGDLIRAVRASLESLRLLPDRITLPTYAATWRAPLGPTDFSTHLAGKTGEGKTEVAALQAQHFGPGLDARNLPGSWSSTGNSLEVLAFYARDTLLVVDDFAPGGTSHDVQRLHREAARLLRAKGNQSGRGRLRSDSTLRPDKPPQGLILSTGEDVPAGHSVRARLFVLDFPAGEMDWERLSNCQEAAREGFYAQAMAGYLSWLAPRYEEVQKRRQARTVELRSKATAATQHRRTPSIVADLAFGMETFLAFAQEAGALDAAEVQAFWDRTWEALGEAATVQADHLEAADPVPRFLELLRSAVVAGHAHVVSGEGQEPKEPHRWGWREKVIGAGENERMEWQSRGDQIGWVVGKDLYLEPDAAFRVARQMVQHEGLTVTPRTLWKRLKEKGKLAATDEKRQRNTVRVTLQGSRREVLHLRSATLMPGKPDQPSQKGRKGVKAGTPAKASKNGSRSSTGKPSQRTVPQDFLALALSKPKGTVGTVSRTKGSRAGEEWGEV